MAVATGSFRMMGDNILEGIQLISAVTCLPIYTGLTVLSLRQSSSRRRGVQFLYLDVLCRICVYLK